MAIEQELRIGLGSPGVCTACLGEVAFELERGDGPRVERFVAATLWCEGFGETVEVALEHALRRDVPGAAAALEDFRARGCRSDVYRAVVRRLARELAEATRRAMAAALN